jgi:hypothetical protein
MRKYFCLLEEKLYSERLDLGEDVSLYNLYL